MRRVIFSFMIPAFVACGSPPPSAPRPAAAPVSSAQEATLPQQGASQRQSSEPGSVPEAQVPTAPATNVMDAAGLETQIDTIYSQNPKLNTQQADAMSVTTMDLIKASQMGDQKAVSSLSTRLLNEALLSSQGFGLVDAGGLANAIQDLVEAAINADVAGILDAVEDIVAAVTA